MTRAERIARQMAAFRFSPEAQVIQTDFRLRLVDAWEVGPGERILEIGCGQGDTTAVLADAVGNKGSVTAVDPASPAYGAPVTLGDSARHLALGELGRRIQFRCEFDPTDPTNAFLPDAFDTVVLAHCSWYFSSVEQLRKTLEAVNPWAKRLCFSEWDLQPRSLAQMGHLLAVLVQGQVEAYKERSESNVRTPLLKSALRAIIKEAGWKVVQDQAVDSSMLQDGGWEIGACLSPSFLENEASVLPPGSRSLVETQLEILRGLDQSSQSQSLNSYLLVAVRSDV